MRRIIIILPIFWHAGLTRRSYIASSEQLCEAGEVVDNNCIECVCTENYVFNCTASKLPCTKRHGSKRLKKHECQPHMVYVHKDMTCMCHKNGRWPDKRCRSVFNAIPTKQTCKPNSYIVEGCNVCHCGPTGKIYTKHCTQNDCSEIERRSSQLNNVQGSCEPKNWYSLAACQFCYCVSENQLVCSTGNSKFNKVLELGVYNLTTCGKQMIKDIMGLVPEADKSLRFGKSSSTILTTRAVIHKPYERPTTVPPPLKTTSSYTAKKKVIQPNLREQSLRDRLKRLNQIVNKDIESDSYESEEQTSSSRTIKLFRKSTTRRRPSYVTNNLDQQDDSSEETTVSDKPKVVAVTTPKVAQIDAAEHKPRLKIPISAKISFGNAEALQRKAKVVNALSEKTNDGVYKINIPSVLDKILSLAMKRRSMIKLNTQSHCVPGQATTEGCNKCFCLANGKLLCTHNKSCNGTNSGPQ